MLRAKVRLEIIASFRGYSSATQAETENVVKAQKSNDTFEDLRWKIQQTRRHDGRWSKAKSNASAVESQARVKWRWLRTRIRT